MSNRNTFYATTFVDELARNGLRAVCAAPGSRHTPLMLAFARHPDIRVYSHLDERSAAFFALGLALATDAPVATVCTSGTAMANQFPAVIEAHQSRVPLLILTADRPHELRNSGANQTIDQTKLFGEYALLSIDAALPEATPPAVAIRNLRTTAARAYATANGTRKGVVHINLPYRKPLEPLPVAGDITDAPRDAAPRGAATPFTQWAQADNGRIPEDTVAELRHLFSLYDRGLIICGGRMPWGDEVETAIAKLCRATGYPVAAEHVSQVRRYKTETYHALGGYDFYLGIGGLPSPDVVIRFGDVPISNALNTYIDKAQPAVSVQVSADGFWSDDLHQTSHFVQADPVTFSEQIRAADAMQRPSNFWATLYQMEQSTWEVIDHEIEHGAYFDGAVMYDVVDLLPDFSTLFAGNSLPIRHLDQFGKPSNKRVYAYANRGASGIDGNISTALGTGAARPAGPLVAVIGDITFYHDMNGLLAVQRCGVPVTIVLLNNDGGGIFQRLPIRDFEPAFSDYFLTPHGLDFSHAAHLYGLDYRLITDRPSFRAAFADCVASERSTIIEVRTDSATDERRRQEITRNVRNVVGGILAEA